MTGRERLTAVLQKQPRDRLSWAPNVDGETLARLPSHMNQWTTLDFYRSLGADIFLLDCWGTPYAFRSPELRWPGFLKQTDSTDPQNPAIQIRTWTTPKGELVGISNRGHPVKYPVDSRQAVRLYREIWEGATFLAHDDAPTLTALDALDVIGEDLVVLGCLDPTVWISGPIEQIGPALDRLVTPRLHAANFVLCPFADGIPVPLERFQAVRQWMERKG